MANIVVVGTQWGDEGKGKVVDVITPHVDVVVRYQGGNNAGHTVVVGREKYVLQSIPSGILHRGCRCVVGCGVVVDPGSLIEEMESLVQRGVTLDGNLFISKNAHLIMPYHPALDRASEAKLGKRRIGTTGKGVGPAYVDKAARVGIRMADLLNEPLFREKLELNVAQKNRLLREIYDAQTFTVEEILNQYLRYAGWLAPYVTDTALLLTRWIDSGYKVLFEGAQGTMLDVDHGTYPYITSSSTTAGGAATGTGVPPTRIHGVLGVSKAYTTRVGGGPFPSEMSGAIAEHIRARGNEYGAVTGRPRRCGWFDAVVGRYAVRINGLDTVALTKLDVLDQCETIKVCTGYRYRGEILTDFPEDETVVGEAEPAYEELEGWGASTRGAKNEADLPAKARRYLERLEELLGVPFCLISTGAQRDETILCEDSPLLRWFPSVRSSLL
ncbi:MAG: adenylosuccinate synthase [Candidatus Rokuibacteriota bacterium]|jgi:adenylosuccinate synthase|nr:MAG: adenylosuccinate synthase [Candidatus Rokubacteria bacterium 13_2_20CM_69_15_1]OLB52619.1 MAG: adenylosuccinate synthase [Candidatus Rokubacteria bacterium 13_2_20CM_2_70_11]PYN34611.1 MAG: adenylosuccinate synthase [Candidatus Rokubacteria bacterium]